jgi:hypothetical protein
LTTNLDCGDRWGMIGSLIPIAAPGPKSLIEGVEQAVIETLGITGLRHRSALRRLSSFNGVMLVEEIHRIIEDNYARSGASANKDRSRENWRWHSLQPQISPKNRSPEVIFERAIAAACDRLGRVDWANQVPVASGMVASARDGRRAIDLVRRRGQRRFELIELKIASDTPFYAAIEIIVYGCLWLIARSDKPSRGSDLLDADYIDLQVLAPSAYYSGFALNQIEAALDAGVRALGRQNDIVLTFAYKLLDERIRTDAILDDATLLACLDHAASATAVAAA